jgi:hypothetical protein
MIERLVPANPDLDRDHIICPNNQQLVRWCQYNVSDQPPKIGLGVGFGRKQTKKKLSDSKEYNLFYHHLFLSL